MRTIHKLEEIQQLSGTELGTSDWLSVDQARIDAFAAATDDHQWIHVDPQRAAGSPFGKTIAHGFLTLSLAPALMAQIWKVEGIRMAINYGLNKLRFPHPVVVGSRVRLRASVQSAEPIEGGLQVVLALTFEIDGAAKPACVAEWVSRYYA